MKLLFRCSIASLVFCAVVGLGSILAFNGPLAILLWPGIVLVDMVFAWLGFYASGSTSVLPWQVPGLLLDVVLYTLVFWVLSLIWRMFAKRRRSS